jgi:hypothetical protein
MAFPLFTRIVPSGDLLDHEPKVKFSGNKKGGVSPALYRHMLIYGFLPFIYDIFDLTVRQVEILSQALIGDSIYQPPLDDFSVSLRITTGNPLIRQPLNVRPANLDHLFLILPVPWHMLHFL